MKKEECFHLGRIIRTHGIKGEVVATLDVDAPAEYVELDGAFVDINGTLVLYEIQKMQVRNNGQAIIHFDGINSEEEAEDLLDLDLYLPLSILPPLDGNRFYYHEIIGYSVIDNNRGEIGFVKRVLDMPQQAVLEVVHPMGKEVLVPVADEIIKGIDRENKIMVVELPEGLLEIYLQ